MLQDQHVRVGEWLKAKPVEDHVEDHAVKPGEDNCFKTVLIILLNILKKILK